jgi:hypothetical protein
MPSSDPIPQTTEEAPTAPAAELPTVSAPASVSHPQTKKKKKKK